MLPSLCFFKFYRVKLLERVNPLEIKIFCPAAVRILQKKHIFSDSGNLRIVVKLVRRNFVLVFIARVAESV